MNTQLVVGLLRAKKKGCPRMIMIAESVIFTESAPLGRFSHRVVMSVCLSVCVFAPLDAVFFKVLIGPEIT